MLENLRNKFGKKEDAAENDGIIKLKPKSKTSKKVRNRVIAGGIVVVLLGLLILPGLFAPEVLPTVGVSAPIVGDIKEVLDTSGFLQSNQVKTYFSPVNAVVEEVHAEVGLSVKKGEKLVVFDTTDLENQNQEAQLQKDSSQYGYQDTLNQGEKAEGEFASASAKVASLEASVKSKENEIKGLQSKITEEAKSAQRQAEAKVQELDSQLAEKTSQLTQNQEEQFRVNTDLEMAGEQLLLLEAAEEEEHDEKAIEEKKNEIKGYEEQLVKLKNEEAGYNQEITSISAQMANVSVSSNADSYQQQLENASNDLAKLQSDLAEQKGIKSSSEAAILSEEHKAQIEANSNLSDLSASSVEELIEKGKEGIKAEFSGVISEVGIVEGASAMQGTSLVTIASNEDVSVEISVTKNELEKIQIGQKAVISIGGYTYDGAVDKINKIATTNSNGVAVIGARIKVENPDENIYLGMEGKVTVELASSEDAMLVPIEAVNVGKDGSFCYVADNGVVTRKVVETGITSNEYIEIISGLSLGDQVVVDVAAELEEGTAVNVTPVERSGAVSGDDQNSADAVSQNDQSSHTAETGSQSESGGTAETDVQKGEFDDTAETGIQAGKSDGTAETDTQTDE